MALSTPLQRLFLSLGLLMDPDPTTQYPFAMLKAFHGPLQISAFRECYLGASARQGYDDAYVILLETMKHTITESKSEHEYLRVTVCPTPSHWNDERSHVRIVLERHAFIPLGSSRASSAFSSLFSEGSVDALDVIGLYDPTTSKTRRVNYMQFSPPNSTTSVVPRDGSLPFFLFILMFSRVRDVLASYNLKESNCYVLARGTMEVSAAVTRRRMHQASDSRDTEESTDPNVGSSSNVLPLPTSAGAGRYWGVGASRGFSEDELQEILVALESDVEKVGTYWDYNPPGLADGVRAVGADRGAARGTGTSVKTTMKKVQRRLRITVDKIFHRT